MSVSSMINYLTILKLETLTLTYRAEKGKMSTLQHEKEVRIARAQSR